MRPEGDDLPSSYVISLFSVCACVCVCVCVGYLDYLDYLGYLGYLGNSRYPARPILLPNGVRSFTPPVRA